MKDSIESEGGMVNSNTLVGLLRERSVSMAQHPVYTFISGDPVREHVITYEALDRRARSVAVQLQARCHLGDRVLLLHKSGIGFLAAFFGCLYAGVIPVTAYPPRHGRRMPGLEGMASDAEATMALTDPETLNDLDSCLDKAPILRRLDWIACDSTNASLENQWNPPDLSGDMLAYLQYTSGSTSKPKGVMVSHENLLCNLRHLESGFSFSPDSVMVSWLPVFHDMGLILGLLQSAFSGGTCIFMASATFAQRPLRWLKAISDYRATHSAAPNFAYDLCVDMITDSDRNALDLRTWSFAINAAETVRFETIQRFNRAFAPCGFAPSAFKPSYGLAEAVLRVTCTLPGSDNVFYTVDAESLKKNQVLEVERDFPDARVLVGCGGYHPETEICIVDPNSQKKCTVDSIGEIWVRGSSVAKGYWQNEEATQQTFGVTLTDTGEGPWLRTGDLGFVRSGELFVVGRLKELIIIRGNNYYPQDVEATVQQSHPDLQLDAGAAFSVETSGEERLVVVQEVRRTAVRNLNTNSILEAIRSAIYTEHGIELVELVLVRPVSISKTSSGKIMRNFTRQRFLDAELKSVFWWKIADDENEVENAQVTIKDPFEVFENGCDIHSLPRSEQHALLQDLICDQAVALMDIDSQISLDPQRSLIELGLDSIGAVAMSERLGDRVGLSLPATLLFEYPTTGALTVYLAGELFGRDE